MALLINKGEERMTSKTRAERKELDAQLEALAVSRKKLEDKYFNIASSLYKTTNNVISKLESLDAQLKYLSEFATALIKKGIK